jgi:uncharacterized protein YybS (DUF2232 family)
MDHSALKSFLEFLLEKFKWERRFYLFATLISLCVILFIAYRLIIAEDYYQALSLALPAGALTYSTSRILKMWSDCVGLLKTFMSK